MENLQFKETLDDLEDYNTYQFRIVHERMEEIRSRKCVSLELETPIKELLCPHCKSAHFQRWGKRSDLQRYRCKLCKKTFNSLTGTPLARLKRKGHWLDYANCLIDSITIRAAAKRCSVSVQTAFRWRHRFLSNSKNIKANSLCGVVEADEIKFPISFKGQKEINRPSRRRGRDGRSEIEETGSVSFFIGRDRNKFTYDEIIKKMSTLELHNTFSKKLDNDVLLCCDNKNIYKRFAKERALRIGFVDVSKGEIIKKDVIHIQNISKYCQRLKSWMKRFHGVATKYLESYVSWFRGFDELGSLLTPLVLLRRAKKGDESSYLPKTAT